MIRELVALSGVTFTPPSSSAETMPAAGCRRRGGPRGRGGRRGAGAGALLGEGGEDLGHLFGVRVFEVVDVDLSAAGGGGDVDLFQQVRHVVLHLLPGVHDQAVGAGIRQELHRDAAGGAERPRAGAASRGRRGGGRAALEVDRGQGLRGLGRDGVGQRVDPKDPGGPRVVDLAEDRDDPVDIGARVDQQQRVGGTRTRRPSRPWRPAASPAGRPRRSRGTAAERGG